MTSSFIGARCFTEPSSNAVPRYPTVMGKVEQEVYRAVLERIEKARLQHPDRLVLSNLGLSSLLSSLLGPIKAYLPQLRLLDLSFNRLTSLPGSIGHLAGLEVLRLSNNKLITLPNTLATLTSLRELDLRDNDLLSLPALFNVSSGLFPGMTSLLLHGNPRLAIPEEILGRSRSTKIRINELARELEVKTHEILDILPELGVTEKKTHSSSLGWNVVPGGAQATPRRTRSGACGDCRSG